MIYKTEAKWGRKGITPSNLKRLLPFGPDVTLTIRVIREDIQIMKGFLIVRKLGI